MSSILFWIVTAALAAGLGGLVLAGAAVAVRRAGSGVDPALAVHRRQLAELDELAARGLLPEAERRAAYAEAGRRLLAAEAQPKSEAGAAAGSSARLAALTAAFVAAVGALALYVLMGSPGFGDQPYKRRLESWLQGDPSRLGAPELAAVLRQVVRTRPNDPQALAFLGRAEMESGDLFSAVQAFRKAAALKPDDAEIQSLLGQSLVAVSQDKVDREAEAAFRKAVAANPSDVPARFYLAQALIQAGKRAEGAKALRDLADSLPPEDPRKARLEEEAKVAEGQSIVADAAAGAPAEGEAQAAFIQSMVDRLAARLKSQPDDPDGWARLVRAYGVLKNAEAQQAALAEARKLFANRPADLAKVEAEAGAR